MNFIQTLLETLLLEGKIDDINNQFPHIPNEVKTNILNRMPNPKSPDINHYQWLLKQHSLGHLNDTHNIHDILSKFTKNKSTLKKPKLNQYSNIDELHQAVNGLEAAPISKKQQAAKDTTVLYSSPTMIVRQHHNQQSCIEAAKLPDSNLVKATVKSAEGKQIGKANWCVSADSTEGKQRYNDYTKQGTNPVYSIDTINPDGFTRRHIYVTDNARGTPEFRNENQDGYDYDKKIEKFAKDVPEIMKTPIAQHFDQEKRKQMHLNDILENRESSLSPSHNFSSDDFKHVADKFISDPARSSFLIDNAHLLKTEHINELLKNKDNHLKLAEKSMWLRTDHIDELLKNPDTHDVLSKNIQYLTAEHIDKLIENQKTHINISHQSSYLNPHHINKLIENPDTHKGFSHSLYTVGRKYIDKMYKTTNAQSNLSYHASLLEPHHIDEIIKNPDTHRNLSENLKYLQPHHIDELVKNPDNHHRILSTIPETQELDDEGNDIHNKLTSSHIDEIIKNKDMHTDLIRKNYILSPHHIDKLLENPNNHDLLSIYNNMLQSRHIDEIIKNPTFSSRLTTHPKLESHHIDELIKNPNNHYNLLETNYNLLQPHHIQHLIDNSDYHNLLRNRVTTESHVNSLLEKMKNDGNKMPIRYVDSNNHEFNNKLVSHNLSLGAMNMFSLNKNSHIINQLTSDNKQKLLSHVFHKVRESNDSDAIHIISKHLNDLHPDIVHNVINRLNNIKPNSINIDNISSAIHNIKMNPSYSHLIDDKHIQQFKQENNKPKSKLSDLFSQYMT